MFRLAQLLLVALYVLLPALTVWHALRLRSLGRRTAPLSAGAAMFLGGLFGAAIAAADTAMLDGRLPAAAMARHIYLWAGAGCALWWLNRALLRAAFRLMGVAVDRVGRPVAPQRGRSMLAIVGQRVALAALGAPYLLAMLVVYRPGVQTAATPRSLRLECAEVSFRSGDGVRLHAWWIRVADGPSPDNPDAAGRWAQRTIILCHSVGATAQQHLALARLLAHNGYNVLMPELRGHGRSGGAFVGFGDVERRDVLAAVRWLREHQPEASQRIFGIGTGTGAAALLAAAADGGDGRLIDALVLCEPFARLDTLAEAVLGEGMPREARWLLARAALAMASAHAGTDLLRFAPADFADDIWPRPVLVIHGRQDGLVPVFEEMALYRSLPQPKEEFWPGGGDGWLRPSRQRGDGGALIRMLRDLLGVHGGAWRDPGVQHRTLRFLEEARPMPFV